MASEKEAQRAREQYSDFLRRLGAHSIAVYELQRRGQKGFAVVAYFSEKPAEAVPETLELGSGKRKLAVPLVVEVMKMPSAE